jgi:hypothetical protein
MGDWIDDLDEQESGKSADERRRQDIRLHDERIVCAKAPEFWKALLESVRADCLKLQSRYPDRLNRQAQVVQERDNHFVLEGKLLPIRSVALDLNVGGHFIRSVKNVKDEFNQGPQPTTEQINIRVEPPTSLVLESQDGEFRTIQDFARHLFGFVLDLPD